MVARSTEGSGIHQFAQTIKDLGYNKNIDIQLGTVTSAAPDLRIQLNADNIELIASDLIIAQRLTKYTQKINIGGTMQDCEFQDPLVVGDVVILVEIVDEQNYVVLDKAVTY